MNISKKIESLTIQQLLIISVVLALLIVVAKNWNTIEPRIVAVFN